MEAVVLLLVLTVTWTFFFAVFAERAVSLMDAVSFFAFAILAASSSAGFSAALSIATVIVEPVVASDIAFSSSCV